MSLQDGILTGSSRCCPGLFGGFCSAGRCHSDAIAHSEVFAIRVKDTFNIKVDGFDGIDYTSSQTAPHAAIAGVKVPLLTMGMTGHYEYLNAENLHPQATSNDTSIVFVEDAQHTIITCTECESYPGEYGNTAETCFNYVGQWLAKPGRIL